MDTEMAFSAELHLLRKEVFEAVEMFCRVQEAHCQVLSRGVPRKGMSLWQDERQQAFERLRHCLDRVAVAGELQADGVFMARLKTLLADVNRGEEKLTRLVGTQRGLLQQQMSEIRRGRKAVKGYGPAAGAAKPRFLSSRT